MTESLVAKSPWAAGALLVLVGAGIVGIGLRGRSKVASAAKGPAYSLSPELPRSLRFGRQSAMAAANRLMTPAQGAHGAAIDVRASIRRHVRLGYWDGLVRARPSHPAYLALTRRPLPSDARALVTESAIGELADLGVPIDTFYFDGESRLCAARETGRTTSLQDLARERREDRLLVFGESHELAERASVLREWHWRRQFRSASLAALARLDLPENPNGVGDERLPPDWSLETPPSEIADRLQAWLRPTAFQWLATCAIYSEFNGALLLYLGEMPELGELSESDLDRVLSLPFVSDGSIPEPLRIELLDRLEPPILDAARLRIVDLLREQQPIAEANETFRVEYAAQRWLATRSNEDRVKFADAVRGSVGDPIRPGSALFAWTEEAMPFWTPRRRKGLAKWAGVSALVLLAIAAFLPLLPGHAHAHGIGSQPLGADFGDWNCFTKVEQILDWRLPAGTEVNKLSVTGYDQAAPNEGFHLLSGGTPAGEVDGPQAGLASLEFAPLHAKEYTGVLTVGTNHGTFRFGLRGTGVYGGDNCVDEGHGELGLESDFNGNGCNQISENHGAVTALLAPARPTAPADTHSALVLGQWWQGDFDLQCGVRTIAQLRDPAPNAWEVGWLIWNFTDLQHFYYIALKANGWELGRRDGVGPKDQRYLATKDHPIFLPGRRYMIHVTRHGDELSVEVDGVPLVTIRDTDHPVDSGRIGFYSECAVSKFDSLQIH